MYQWQGENVKVLFGYSTVTENKEKPLFWYNYEVAMAEGDEALIPAIKITTKAGDSFVLANHYGIGLLKLRSGGWPDKTHFSLPADSFQVSNRAEFVYTVRQFNQGAYSRHEENRRKWQEKNVPKGWEDEYEKIEGLRSLIKKGYQARKDKLK
jgi:hypothetical protein